MPTSDFATLAAVFSPAVVKALSSAEIGAPAARIARLLEPDESTNITLASAFEAAHRKLFTKYKTEYTFKNQIVSKVILGRHSPTTASAIMEQPMGTSIADVVILNGTSTVYEIKTDFDTFTRLPTQIADYQKFSEYVYVVVSDRRIQAAEQQVPKNIGILGLNRRGSFSVARPASSNLAALNHRHLFQLLRTHEAVSLAQEATGETLHVPTGYLREAAYERFQLLPVAHAHTATVAKLKDRGSNAGRLMTYPDFPPSLRALAYATEPSGVGADRLRTRLHQSVADVLSL